MEVRAAEGLAMCHLVNPEALAAIDRMCERFPDTPVVIDHFARIGVDGTIRARDVDALCRLARHGKTYVKLSAFYALGEEGGGSQPHYARRVLARWMRYDVIALDEVGYVPLAKIGAEFLFRSHRLSGPNGCHPDRNHEPLMRCTA